MYSNTRQQQIYAWFIIRIRGGGKKERAHWPPGEGRETTTKVLNWKLSYGE